MHSFSCHVKQNKVLWVFFFWFLLVCLLGGVGGLVHWLVWVFFCLSCFEFLFFFFLHHMLSAIGPIQGKKNRLNPCDLMPQKLDMKDHPFILYNLQLLLHQIKLCILKSLLKQHNTVSLLLQRQSYNNTCIQAKQNTIQGKSYHCTLYGDQAACCNLVTL